MPFSSPDHDPGDYCWIKALNLLQSYCFDVIRSWPQIHLWSLVTLLDTLMKILNNSFTYGSLNHIQGLNSLKMSINWKPFYLGLIVFMMTSSNGNIFRVTGPLCGEFTSYRRIPLTKASDMQLCCILWSAPEQRVEQTIETPVILDAITLIMTSL